MTAAACVSFSDDDALYHSTENEKETLLLIRSAYSEPSLNKIRKFHKRKAARLRKKWLQEFYSSLSPDKLNQVLKKKKRLAKGHKEEEESASYKYGRLAMIALALFSIPVDGWKLYQEVGRTERSLDGPTSIEVFDYYSSAITTHVIGLAAAVDNSLIITIGCRMLSTVLYQTSYSSKGNSSVPTDPKQLQKYIRDNVPAHRLPKGYRFTDDLDSGKTASKKKKKKNMTKKKSARKSKSKGKEKSTTTKSKRKANKKPGTRDQKKASSRNSGKSSSSKKP